MPPLRTLGLRHTWLLLTAPPLLGIAVMLSHGAAPQRWLVHLLALLLGMAAFGIAGTITRLPQRAWSVGSLILVGLVASTLTATGTEGVERWLHVGPLQLHPSALLSPCVLVASSVLLPTHARVAACLLITTQVVHLLQPDAGQAAAFGLAGATAVWFASSQQRRWLGAVLVVLGACTWLMPDPLPPAPFVEDILQRAFELGPVLGVAAVASLALVVAVPFLAPRAKDAAHGPRWALGVYFAGSALAPLFGEFPVPLLGYGPSPLIGAFLGLACVRIAEGQVRVQRDEDLGRRQPRRDETNFLCAAAPRR